MKSVFYVGVLGIDCTGSNAIVLNLELQRYIIFDDNHLMLCTEPPVHTNTHRRFLSPTACSHIQHGVKMTQGDDDDDSDEHDYEGDSD